MSRLIAAFVSALLFAVGCTSQPSADSVATAIVLTEQARAAAQPSATATAAPTATPRPTRTPSPTATPLTPRGIFENLSPAVARIESGDIFGSGVLIEGNYILTNAHVVWPIQEATLVFPDGAQMVAPVAGLDLLSDLALLGPIETDVAPLPLANGEGLGVGSPLLLIGYPGTAGRAPQPTLTETIVSRIYEHETLGMTFLQVDAPVAGGQSGGVAATMDGEVIGLTGHRVTDAGFGMVASAADIQPRLERMLAGPADTARGVDPQAVDTHHTFDIADNWTHAVFVADVPRGTTITIAVESENDAVIVIQDIRNIDFALGDDSTEGSERAQLTTTTAGPYFVIVRQHNAWPGSFALESNQSLMPYTDPDDGQSLRPDMTYEGLSDYPVDIDVFRMTLFNTQEFNINVSSLLIDPFLLIEPVALGVDYAVEDESSGGGLNDHDAELTYAPPGVGNFRVLVTDTQGQNAGGYLVTLRQPYSGGPTPVSPPPTATPLTSPVGSLTRYESDSLPFAIAFPFDFKENYQLPICRGYFHCWVSADTDVVIGQMEAELPLSDGQAWTLDGLGVQLETEGSKMGLHLLDHQTITTQTGAVGLVSSFVDQDDLYRVKVFTYLQEPNLFFRVIFTYDDPAQEELADYLFSTFEVTR